MRRVVSRLALPAAAAGLLLALVPGVVRGQTPLYFPQTMTLDTTSYTLRISGIDRYSTAGALARVAAQNQSVNTGYPFNSANATADTGAYGFAACPKSVGIAAGDTVADALAASSIKDLATLAIGSQTIDTTNAVMLLTRSGRQGANDISKETLEMLSDLRTTCGTFDAVIFGSESAVPAGAADAVASVAGKVARVVGADRFDTARAIGVAVNGARGPVTVEHYAAANTKTDLVDTVFLAESSTGADALSVGPYAASKNVPILLTNSTALPVATRNAIAAIRPDNIVVLGGVAAVPDAVVKEATDASPGSKSVRISGADRYATSVAISQQLYNIYPITSGPLPVGGTPSASYANVMVGVARSEGAGASHVGFPDALASAWFLDTAADQATPPKRLAPPVEKNADKKAADGTLTYTYIGGEKGTHRPSLLLTTRTALPTPVSDHLKARHPAATRTATTPTAVNGGFGFIFGGEGAIAQPVVLSIAEALANGTTYTAPNRSDLAVKMDDAKLFYTAMPFTGYATSDGGGVDLEGAIAEGDKMCTLRNALAGAQFLGIYQAASYSTAGVVDYQDSDVSWTPFQSRFSCTDVSSVSSDRAQVIAIGPSGQDSQVKLIDWSGEDLRLSMPTAVTDDKADTVTSGGNPTTEITFDAGNGGSAQGSATWTGVMNVVYKGTAYNDAPYTLTLNFTRNDPPSDPPGQFPGDPADDYITFTGSLTVRSATALLFSANLAGESSTIASPLKLSGMYTTGQGAGGFRATVEAPDATTYRLSDMMVNGTAAAPQTSGS